MHPTIARAVRRAKAARKRRSLARQIASQRGKTLKRGIKFRAPIRRATMTGEPMPGTWPMARNLLGKPGSIASGQRKIKTRIKSQLAYAQPRTSLNEY